VLGVLVLGTRTKENRVSRTLEELDRDSFLAEAESLAQIIQHPAWARFEELLTQMRLSVLEQLATATEPLEVARYQGAAVILREIKERPHQIVAAAQSVIEEESQRHKSVRTSLDLADRVSLEDDL
jgi:hypothetical protein